MKTVIISDLDGVLADNRHRLHYLADQDYESFYGYSNVISDSVIPQGNRLLNALTVDEDTDLWFLTGRNDICMPATEEWLRATWWGKDHHGGCTRVLTRKFDDHRPSQIVKPELMDQIMEKYAYEHDVSFIFIDDDPENVKAVVKKFPFVCGLTFGVNRLGK